MSLDTISILLVETQSAGNIGSVARAMKNMGLGHLVLVNPQTEVTDEARHRACGADDILDGAQRIDSLAQAVSSYHLSIGTSSRLVPWIAGTLGPEQLASDLSALSMDQKAAIVFGPERTGLTNEHLQYCQRLVTIPTVPNFESMNLAHAVAIIAYEIRQHTEVAPSKTKMKLARLDQVESFIEDLQHCLEEIHFLNPRNPQPVIFTLRQILSRAGLEERDVSILRGMLRQWKWYARKANPS
jgi:TrmH family RNA methyltransferase